MGVFLSTIAERLSGLDISPCPQIDAAPSPFSALPPDLIQAIIIHIEDPSDLTSLCHCCRSMHELASRVDTQAAWLMKWRPETAVLDSIYHLQIPVLRQLIEVHGVDVNCTTKGFTPLSFACIKGSSKAVEYLLSVQGIDVNRSNFLRPKAVETLSTAALRKLSTILSDLPKQLSSAALGSLTTVLVELLQGGTETAIAGDMTSLKNFLRTTIRTREIDLARLVLAHPGFGANNHEGDPVSALYWACALGDIGVVHALLRHPKLIADQIEIYTLIGSQGCQSKALQLSILRLLLDHPCTDSFKSGARAASCIVYAKDLDVLRLILSHPTFDVNATTISSFGLKGFTALQYLLFNTEVDQDRVPVLIDCPRVDVNVRGELFGFTHPSLTVFAMACLEGHLEIVRHFLRRPDLDMGSVPVALGLARDRGHRDIVGLIQEDGAVKRAVAIGQIVL